MAQAQRTTATLGFSVAEFCQAHNISIGHFYALKKKGLGPRVMKVGLRTLRSAPRRPPDGAPSGPLHRLTPRETPPDLR